MSDETKEILNMLTSAIDCLVKGENTDARKVIANIKLKLNRQELSSTSAFVICDKCGKTLWEGNEDSKDVEFIIETHDKACNFSKVK